MQYLNDRINQTRQMQVQLRQECREDEAAISMYTPSSSPPTRP